MNNLKLVTPSRAMRVCMSASDWSLTSSMIMWAPTSTQALAARRCQSSRPTRGLWPRVWLRSEEHTSELQSLAYLVCRLLLEKKKKNKRIQSHPRNRGKYQMANSSTSYYLHNTKKHYNT